MTRNEAREALMRILYEIDVTKAFEDGTAAETGDRLIGERMTGGHVNRCRRLFESIAGDMRSIDESINRSSARWKTSRMPKIDLAIMRQAVGEMKFCSDIPAAVSINEAIELAKKYSTDNSAKFIHGVLGAISKSLRGNDE